MRLETFVQMGAWHDTAATVTAATALTALGGGYVQFVLRRSLLPAVEFDVELALHTRGPVSLIAEVDIVVKNIGATVLIVAGVRSRVVYRVIGDIDSYLADSVEPMFGGRLVPARGVSLRPTLSPCVIPTDTPSAPPSIPLVGFVPSAMATPVTSGRDDQSMPPHAVGTKVRRTPAEPSDWLLLTDTRTFIQPGVTQHYRKPIMLPANTSAVHIWGAFDYRIQLGPVTSFLVGRFAPPPETLDWRRGVSNHTVRRTFSVGASGPPVVPASR